MSGTLAQQAQAKPVQNILSVDKYYRSADLLLKQAQDYRKQRNEEQLYVMLLRFASLLLDTIPKHKDFSKGDASYARYKKLLLDTYMPELEKLKLNLDTRDISQPRLFSSNRPADVVQLSVSSLPDVHWDRVALPPGNAPAAPSGIQDGNSSRAVPLPYIELQIDDLLDVVSGNSGPPTASTIGYNGHSGNGNGYGHHAGLGYNDTGGQQQQQHLATWGSSTSSSGTWDSAGAPLAASTAVATTTAAVRPPQYNSTYMASTSAMSERHTLFAQSGSMARSQLYSRSTPPSASNSARYPSVVDLSPQVQQLSMSAGALSPSQSFPSTASPQQSPPQWDNGLGQPSAGPSLQPQEMQVQSLDLHDPFRPATCLDHGQAPGLPQLQPPPPTAQPTPGGPAEIVKKAQLRDVHISVAVMDEFLAYANSNSARNIESCGILSGKLSANDSTFTITTLIIPQQKGTSDTVQAENEEDIFDAQFQRELYPLGWIHTHPSQTCFLSSVDVHTQCGYQTMLEEAVAIVMAPKDRTKKCGIFRLSTPGGLGLVQKCGMHGFHSHPATSTGQDVYELCGHVFLNPRIKHEVIDLRKGDP